jgi:type III pantothenate kinase
MAAASQLADGPIMTVDLGTCTTINVMDAKRTFLGGMILPGIQLELRALADGTAQLPSLMPEPVTELLGRNTRDNMLSGTIACTGLEIQAIADRVERDLDLEKGSLQVILTGGLGQLVLPWIDGPVTYEPDLMLHGLRSILLRNQK